MNELKDLLISWRHELHQYPETAFEEVRTSAFVAERLREMGLEVHTGIGRTGVVGILRHGDGKKMIGIRADMDAINLTETGNPKYKSLNPGKMHGCGHDGHTTTVLGAAKILSENPDFNGSVAFVFQPAEEPGKGSRAMIEDGLFENFPIDEFYGLHNFPTYRSGTVNICRGGVCSCEDNFKIVIHGRGGHASGPENTSDPLVTAAEIIMALQTIVSRNAKPTDCAVVSCTEFFTDGAHNAIPSNVTILGDCRSYSTEMGALIERRMKTLVEHICEMNGSTCEFEYTHEFAPTINHDENVDAVIEAAKHVVGEENVDGNCAPFMGSEDFGGFLMKVPGAFFFLGTGVGDSSKDYPLHNSNFNYNDDMLVTGAELFAEIVRTRLPK